VQSRAKENKMKTEMRIAEIKTEAKNGTTYSLRDIIAWSDETLAAVASIRVRSIEQHGKAQCK
jgi:hypothetical protein